jgi:parallel beta-helix repeat protein
MGGKIKISSLFVISILLLTMAQTGFARQIFVDANATGSKNGSSWANAYTSLQDALAAASSGDKILVADGTYKPDMGSGITPKDRGATFKLINGVVISGGYAGYGEPNPDALDVDAYITILSGDLNGDDEPNFTNYGDNSYNVVTGFGTDKTAVLDGFTISGGCSNSNGSGMHNYRGSPTLQNCTFKRNSALFGGGMYNDQSNPTLVDCKFIENSAGDAGAGIYNCTSSPTLTNCTFNNNFALIGGGMYSKNDSNPTLTNCTFNENSARNSGGMANYLNCNPTLTNCTFKGNTASNGGAMRNYSSNPTLTNCTFINNSANGDGGGINNNSSNPILDSCLLVENSAKGNGGAIRNYQSNPTLTGCTLAKNSAGQLGGGISNYENSNAKLGKCILWKNTDSGIDIESGQIYNHGSTPVVNQCCIQGWTGLISGSGNFDKDPMFVDPDNGDYGLSPESPCIKAADANEIVTTEESKIVKEPNVVSEPVVIEVKKSTSTSTAEQPRRKEETTAAPQEHEKQLLVPSIYPTIQAAIDTAYAGDEIIISPGSYTGQGNRDIDFKGKAITVRSTNPQLNDVIAATIIDCENEGRGFYFHSGEDANSTINGLTIINGNSINGGAVYCKDSSPTLKNCILANNSGGGLYNDNSKPTLTNCIFNGNISHYGGGGIYNTNSNPTIISCTFKGNKAKYGGGIENSDGSSTTLKYCMFNNNSTTEYGGAISNHESNPTLTNCVFTRNSTNGNGGAIFNEGGITTLTSCKFIENTADDNGGGMFNSSGQLTLTSCTFRGNAGYSHGGGLFNGRSNPALTNCTFSTNSANINGGGMYIREGIPILMNCTFSGNMAKKNGGGIFNNDNPTLTNCTFSGNTAETGGGLCNNNSSFNCKPTLTNCIFWDNKDSSKTIESAQIYGGIPDVSYTCVQNTDMSDPNAYPGPGNIKDNPCFVKQGYWADSNNQNVPAKMNDPNSFWVEGDYHLRPDSPCIDAGNPKSDFSNEPQPNGGRVNMGAYGNTPEAASKGRTGYSILDTRHKDTKAQRNQLYKEKTSCLGAFVAKKDYLLMEGFKYNQKQENEVYST